jgi:hypothetical protein
MVPWEVEMASGEVTGTFQLEEPEFMTRAEAHFNEDTFIGALARELQVFLCYPSPKPGSVCIRAPSQKDKVRYDRAVEELEEGHQAMVEIVVG